MLSKKLNEAINEQITFEFYSSHIYLAMAAKLEGMNLPGAANYMKVQVEEERFHAMKMFDFIVEAGGDVEIQGFESPDIKSDNILDIFKETLHHEKIVTQRIYGLMDIAQEEKNYGAINFLNWFIDEQIEEEATADDMIKKLTLIGNDGNGLYQIDKELGQRVFTPPVK